MPDVSLFTATKPVPKGTPVVIRFSVEVGGLPVYNESYDVDKLSHEVKKDKAKALPTSRAALSACMTGTQLRSSRLATCK